MKYTPQEIEEFELILDLYEEDIFHTIDYSDIYDEFDKIAELERRQKMRERKNKILKIGLF